MPLYEAVLEALHAVTDGVAPVLLVLEDLHWADASTRDLLRFVLARLSDERLLVVGTYPHRRPAPAPPAASPARRARPAAAGRACRRRALRRPRSWREYLQLLHGGEVPDAVVEDIRSRSEGNAYYAEELLAAADDDAPRRGAPGRAARAARRRPARAARAAAGRPSSRSPGWRPSRAVACPIALLRAASACPSPSSTRRCARPSRTTCSCRRRRSLRVPARPAAGGVYGDLLPGERVRLHATYAQLLAAGDGASAADLARHAMAAHDLPWRSGRVGSARPTRPSPCWRPPRHSAHFEQALQLLAGGARGSAAAGLPTRRGSRWARPPPPARPGSCTGRSRVRHRGGHADEPGDRAPGGRGTLPAGAPPLRRRPRDDAERESAHRPGAARGRGAVPADRVWTVALEARILSHARSSSVSPDVDRTRPRRGARRSGSPPPRPTCSSAWRCRRGPRASRGRAERPGVRTSRPRRRRRSRRRAARGRQPGHQPDRQRRPRGARERSSRAASRRPSAPGSRSRSTAPTHCSCCCRPSCSPASGTRPSPSRRGRARGHRARSATPSSRRCCRYTWPVTRSPVSRSRTSCRASRTRRRGGSHTVLAPRADAQRWLGDAEGAVRTVEECLRLQGERRRPLGTRPAGRPRPRGRRARRRGGLRSAAGRREQRCGGLRAQGEEWSARAREVAARGRPRLGQMGPEGTAWLARTEAETGRLTGRGRPGRLAARGGGVRLRAPVRDRPLAPPPRRGPRRRRGPGGRR